LLTIGPTGTFIPVCQEGQMVMLYQELSDDEPGLLCADHGPRTARTGRALRQDLEGGTYLVRFTDGEEPETGQGLMTWDSQWTVCQRHCWRGWSIPT